MIRGLGLRRCRLPLLPLAGVMALCLPERAMLSQSAAAPPEAVQIAAAVLPLPENLRAGAAVLGYRTSGRLELLRAGSNGMRCLADNPAEERFHVACYHESMEPFMARGRSLREEGVTGPQVDTVRFAEVTRGVLAMPTFPASLYQLSGPRDAFDVSSGTAKGTNALFVIYIPGATVASTGLSDQPSAGRPWIMFPGTPKAHIMFTPNM